MRISAKKDVHPILKQLDAAKVAIMKAVEAPITGEVCAMLEDAETLTRGAVCDLGKLIESLYTDDGNLKD